MIIRNFSLSLNHCSVKCVTCAERQMNWMTVDVHAVMGNNKGKNLID